MAAIELVNLTKRYARGITAVDDLSLSVRDGELLALVGPSGCGKSTTLRMIAGLEQPTAGEIHIAGQAVARTPADQRDVAMVFQSFALYPHMTVVKNLSFGLRLRRKHRWSDNILARLLRPAAYRRARDERETINRRVRETAALLGIEPLLQRMPAALSGGEQQRVAVARAITRQPKLFLFDEPLSDLDPQLRANMRAELKQLHAQLRTTTLHVSHDQEEALSLGDRVAVLAAGRLQQVAPPRELYDRPQNRFVAGFIGRPRMNFLPAKIANRQLRVGNLNALIVNPTDQAPASIELGIRPQHLRLHPPVAGLPGRVTLLEFVGDATFAHVTLDTPATRIIAQTPSDAALAVGDNVGITIDWTRTHAFDTNGDRIDLTLE